MGRIPAGLSQGIPVPAAGSDPLRRPEGRGTPRVP